MKAQRSIASSEAVQEILAGDGVRVAVSEAGPYPPFWV